MNKLAIAILLAVSALSTGCINRANVQTKVQQALVFEDKVHTQVLVLETVFTSAVQFLPPEKRAEATAKLEQAELILQQALDAKDNALQAALEASSEQVDMAALIPPIIKAVEGIIAIIADVRSFAKATDTRAVAAMPTDDVLDLQREKLRQLAGAAK